MLETQREYIIFIVGLVVGLLLGYIFFSGPVEDISSETGNGTDTTEESNDPDDTTDEENDEASDTDETATTTEETSVELEVNDQSPGDTVSIAHAFLEDPSWIAIREQAEDDTPGTILGARLFPKGTASGTVKLLRGTMPDRTYYATVYTDDGDHEFEFEGDDTIVTTANGEAILVEFKTLPTSPN